MYGFLADLVVFVHVLYVGYVVVGQGLIVLAGTFKWEWGRNPWFRWTHLLMIAIVVVEEFVGWVCPLTDWERELRVLAGQTVNDQTFMWRLGEYLLFSKDKLHGWTPQTITAVNVAFGALVIQGFLMFPPRWFRFGRKPAAAPAPAVAATSP
jgi:hypothetical protein